MEDASSFRPHQSPNNNSLSTSSLISCYPNFSNINVDHRNYNNNDDDDLYYNYNYNPNTYNNHTPPRCNDPVPLPPPIRCQDYSSNYMNVPTTTYFTMNNDEVILHDHMTTISNIDTSSENYSCVNNPADATCFPQANHHFHDNVSVGDKLNIERMKDGANKIVLRVKTKLEVLDDGYRWRKYGKKKLKTSPNLRNYYKCSTIGCKVKKRVERDRDDSSYVMATYIGNHNHQLPLPHIPCPNCTS